MPVISALLSPFLAISLAVPSPGIMPGWENALPSWLDVEPQEAHQVRVEQRMQIRVLPPRANLPVPDMLVGVPRLGGFSTRVVERKIGKCVSASGIASVRPERDNRILFLMHNRRVVSAELERSCRARDFYSGFLIERNEDGRLCAERDSLLSRSGMSCKLIGIRELVEEED